MLGVARLFRSVHQSPLQYGAALMSHRMLSMHTINDNLYLCTDKPRNIQIDKKTLRFTQTKDNKKPIILMISWFNSQKNQINKYSELYTDQGFDVLVGRISLSHFLFKIKSVEDFGAKLADVLVANEDQYPEIFIHSFSAAGGMWGISQRKQKQNPAKYDSIPKRIIGQVWDSVAHSSMVIVALPVGLFPDSKIMQYLVKSFLFVYLRLYVKLQSHYNDAINQFIEHRATAPALLIASKVDPIGTVEFIESLAKRWRERKIEVTYKCFPDSPHIKHYQKYPEEYMKLVHELWDRVKLLERK